MSLCHSIDTLSMAYLDDELASEERRELELHLLDCASCRQQVDSERADLVMVRKALTAPPASALLKARIVRALDAEDVAVARSQRRRWQQWFLPGSAIFAAAAAILVFIGAGAGIGEPGGRKGEKVAQDVYRQEIHAAPLEVQGASTGPWLRTNFDDRLEPPQFTQPGIALLGARLLPNGIANHDAALLSYLVTIGESRIPLSAVVLKDLRGEELSGGDAYRIGGLTLRVLNANGMPAVTYIDPNTNVGYVFASERMSVKELIQLVVSTDLIARAQQSR
jgi:anti-sigma factor RsiW